VIPGLDGRLAFGGDYNPEQWPEEVWDDDIALMREAGVTLVTLGVFSWALLEPSEGVYEFGWLDRIVEKLAAAGIAIDMATATASPPAWFTQAYPQSRLVDARGVVRSFGARQNYCPSSPEYRRAAAALALRVAQRYADHPAVVLWHVNNEYGCHNWHCFCDVSAAAFRTWLERRYGSLTELNESWGTAFWSQRYTDWQQIEPPRVVAYNTFANPGQQLDWWRFSSDELLACYRAEVEAIRPVVTQPITTNFMGFFKPLDYWSWAREVDVVTNDHYLQADDPLNMQDLAMTADLMRSLGQGKPWLVMEHSTSAVNWQARNAAKVPGQMRRNSFQHVARGSDGAMFFQWRASRAGAEKFHSALVPHAGRDSKVWREVVKLGSDLGRVAEAAGTTVEPASVAMMFGWPSWWAATLDSHPSVDADPLRETRAWHRALWERSIAVDFVEPGADLAGRKLVIVPMQYLLDDDALDSLHAHVAAGGSLLVTYFSGIVDHRDHIRLGGYPAGLSDLLGVRVEEFFPLLEDETAALSATGPGSVWSEWMHVDGAEVVASFESGPLAGKPAITRRQDESGGLAWYVGTDLDPEGRSALLDRVLSDASVEPVVAGLPAGVEAVRRSDDGRSYLFVLNHDDRPVEVARAGTELLTGVAGTSVTVPAGGVAVIREHG